MLMLNPLLVLAFACCFSIATSADTVFASSDGCEKACTAPCYVIPDTRLPQFYRFFHYGCKEIAGQLFDVKEKCEGRCGTECVYTPLVDASKMYGVAHKYWCLKPISKDEYCLRFGQYLWVAQALCMNIVD